MNDFEPEKLLRSPWVAGGLGALVALKGAPGATWPERIFNVVCGVLIAGYASPALAEYLALQTPAMQSVTAFVAGLFGMNIVAGITLWLRETKVADLIPWFKRGP